MTTLDPGDEWREVTDPDENLGDAEVLILFGNGYKVRWVKKPPLPSLPTENYSSIRVVWKSGERTYREMTLEDSYWWILGGGNSGKDEYVMAEDLPNKIKDFEVLSTPDNNSSRYETLVSKLNALCTSAIEDDDIIYPHEIKKVLRGE